MVSQASIERPNSEFETHRPFPAPVAEPHPALALPSVRLHLDKQRLGWSYVLKEDGDIQTELRHNNGSTPVQSSLNQGS